jgi:hypothetical protein
VSNAVRITVPLIKHPPTCLLTEIANQDTAVTAVTAAVTAPMVETATVMVPVPRKNLVLEILAWNGSGPVTIAVNMLRCHLGSIIALAVSMGAVPTALLKAFGLGFLMVTEDIMVDGARQRNQRKRQLLVLQELLMAILYPCGRKPKLLYSLIKHFTNRFEVHPHERNKWI